jgi:hypothetical protein
MQEAYATYFFQGNNLYLEKNSALNLSFFKVQYLNRTWKPTKMIKRAAESLQKHSKKKLEF